MKRLNTVLSTVLELDENCINDNTSPDNVETWDSLKGLLLVTELENTFKVKFSMEEVTSAKSVKDIKILLTKHNIRLED